MSARARIHAMFPLDDAATAELDARLDAHRAEARNEAADWFASYPLLSDGTDWARGRDAYVAWAVSVLRNPDPQRPHRDDTAPEFFQPGRTYTDAHHFRFECHAVAPTPWDGTPRAIGYLTYPDGRGHVHGMTGEQWADGDWDDTTTGGAHG